MSTGRLHVFCSEVHRDGSRTKITNAWIYWRSAESSFVLRADTRGTVMQYTSGDRKSAASYGQEFVAKEGDAVRVAYNTEPDQLGEEGIVARLESFTLKESLSAALAQIGQVNVTGKDKTLVTVLPVAEVQLPQYHPVLRAVAAIRFGGFPNDPQVRNLDRFLDANYGTPGGPPKVFRGDEARGYREELRRVVPASGPDRLDILRDIKSAAEALAGDDANDYAVALLGHSTNDAFGRLLHDGQWISPCILLEQLKDCQTAKGDYRLKRSALERAKARLEEARKKNDPEAIQAAQAEVESRQKDLASIDSVALEMLDAFAEVGQALERYRVSVVELQSCSAAAPGAGLGALSFVSRLSSLLSTDKHAVQVKGHLKALWSNTLPPQVWLGGRRRGPESEQFSTASLPLP